MRTFSHLSAKDRSKRSEKQAARIIRGKVQPASGALRVQRLKHDAISETFLLEDKTTLKNSYRVEAALWRKLEKLAWANNRRPVLRVNFPDTVFYAVDERTFRLLVEHLL